MAGALMDASSAVKTKIWKVENPLLSAGALWTPTLWCFEIISFSIHKYLSKERWLQDHCVAEDTRLDLWEGGRQSVCGSASPQEELQDSRPTKSACSSPVVLSQAKENQK